MTLIGFKRATIGIFDDKGKITKTHILEGTENKGATVTAEISGLSSEPVKTYGSNIAYYVMQKGTGDVNVNFGLLDMPEEFSDELLGYQKSEDFTFIGEKNKVPNAAVLLESRNLKGEPVCLGFFKGKFSKAELNLNTETNENTEIEADSYTFAAMSSDKDDETKGQTVAKYVGTEKLNEFKNLILGEGFPA